MEHLHGQGLHIDAQLLPNGAWLRLQYLLVAFPIERRANCVAIYLPPPCDRHLCALVWLDRAHYWNAVVSDLAEWEAANVAEPNTRRNELQRLIAIAIAPFLEESVFA